MSTEIFSNKYVRSAKIVNKYYRRLMSQVADKVMERESDFENPFLCQAQDFLEQHARSVREVAAVYAALKRCSSPEQTKHRVKEFDATEGSVEKTINAWLDDNPGCVVESLSFVQQSDRQLCVMLYQEISSCR